MRKQETLHGEMDEQWVPLFKEFAAKYPLHECFSRIDGSSNKLLRLDMYRISLLHRIAIALETIGKKQ